MPILWAAFIGAWAFAVLAIGVDRWWIPKYRLRPLARAGDERGFARWLRISRAVWLLTVPAFWAPNPWTTKPFAGTWDGVVLLSLLTGWLVWNAIRPARLQDMAAEMRGYA